MRKAVFSAVVFFLVVALLTEARADNLLDVSEINPLERDQSTDIILGNARIIPSARFTGDVRLETEPGDNLCALRFLFEVDKKARSLGFFL